MTLTYLGDDLVTVLSMEKQTQEQTAYIRFSDEQCLRVPVRWLRETIAKTSQSRNSWAQAQHEAKALTLAQVIKQESGGIAPHWKGTAGALTEEYATSVPLYLRNQHGRPADEVADMLRERHPRFGVETESDLYEALKYHYPGGVHERA